MFFIFLTSFLVESFLFSIGKYFFRSFNSPTGELAQHIETINDYVFKIIQERKKLSKEELSSNRDLLSRFMTLKMANGEEPDAHFLRDLVTNFLLAGRDTTASG